MTERVRLPGPVLVVGGNRGIGAAVVAAFAGATSWSRQQGVDATDERSVQDAAQGYLAAHGAPFALVHAVGDFEERPLLASDLAFHRWLVDSNLTSAFLVVRALVPAMVAAGRGRVVLFGAAGVSDHDAKTRAPVYFAAKAALLSLARSLAKEVAPSGVTVNVVSPGVIRHDHSHRASQDRIGPKVPLGREGTPADVVDGVRYLLSGPAAYVTGTELVIDGGLAL